jgi:hypothetical protein
MLFEVDGQYTDDTFDSGKEFSDSVILLSIDCADYTSIMIGTLCTRILQLPVNSTERRSRDIKDSWVQIRD